MISRNGKIRKSSFITNMDFCEEMFEEMSNELAVAVVMKFTLLKYP